ncbi:alpha- and gamma-adaptin-binding protein p34 [Boleophthalmus pectinirostris]|uniref:alpha- and gamma-adaptin-binding protein p34 n=1 Tax=Boleophthalmus pectinirostris TaxID=150288 RepID=UPI000A1C5F15|nr:alpha- and gamma-adaptin-binding protein p34 [Boleophthalmus pectinirostris]XP_055011745.1 alpha- and gamma-adaptin-binding protein p34 [Boleophthalmus pectinirostris]
MFGILKMSDTEENSAMLDPCVVITSSDQTFQEQELIKQILNSGTLPEPTKVDKDVVWYPWTINNKYYTAEVSLCTVPSTFHMSLEIFQATQAFIAYFDSSVKDGLEKLNPWISVVEEIAPEVLILVCDKVCEDGVTRQEAQQWCLAHSFELIELNPEDLPDEEDDFPESTGVKRIVQALNANVWSNVEMKNGNSQGLGLMSSLVAVAGRHSSSRSSAEPSLSGLSGSVDVEEQKESENPVSAQEDEDGVVDAMTDLDIQELADLTAGNADVDNFERLFTKLKEMKDKASSLPHDQRKVHAERVAKAFWMAIGGDNDEIESLSSGEES